jgi:hypothetical protein
MHHQDGSRAFSVEAAFDGDFWYVGIYELRDGEKRLRFEYKLNTPGDEAGACERAWEIFKSRYLKSGD